MFKKVRILIKTVMLAIFPIIAGFTSHVAHAGGVGLGAGGGVGGKVKASSSPSNNSSSRGYNTIAAEQGGGTTFNNMNNQLKFKGSSKNVVSDTNNKKIGDISRGSNFIGGIVGVNPIKTVTHRTVTDGKHTASVIYTKEPAATSWTVKTEGDSVIYEFE